MLIFALCLELLLRKLGQLLEEEDAFGAFSDDIGIVLSNSWEKLGHISVLGDKFRKCSHLSLNVKKSVVVHLGVTSSIDSFTDSFTKAVPCWADFTIGDHAEYLGVQLGPGRVDKQ